VEDLGIDGKIILQWIYRKVLLDASGSGQGPVVDPCEQSNEPSGSMKGGEFLDWLRDC